MISCLFKNNHFAALHVYLTYKKHVKLPLFESCLTRASKISRRVTRMQASQKVSAKKKKGFTLCKDNSVGSSFSFLFLFFLFSCATHMVAWLPNVQL